MSETVGTGWTPYEPPGSSGGPGGNFPPPLTQLQINLLAQTALQSGADLSQSLAGSLLGSTLRTLANRNADILNVLDYDVIGDGISITKQITVASAAPTVLNVQGAAFKSCDIGKCLFVGGIGAPAAVVTGSIAPATASVIGSISGVTMIVTQVNSGQLVVGATIGGSGVGAGITITAFADGDTTGGVGTYFISSSASIAAGSTITAAYGVLTVSNVQSGSLPTNQVLTGTNVATGTRVASLGTGTGGTGTYFVNISQTVASTQISAPAIGIATTIEAVNSPTQIVMAAAAVSFVSGAFETVTYGSDDSANINTFLAVVAALPVGISGGQNVTVLFPNRIFIVKGSSLNFTNLSYVNIISNNATFYGATNGVCVIDAMGAYGCKFSDFSIIGDQALPPNVGWQIGRYLSGGRAFGLNCGRDITVTGYFSLAGFYNLGSETSEWSRISIKNSYPGAWSAVVDGCNHFGLSSQYVTFTLPANASFTFSVNIWLQCRFTTFGAGSSALWLSALGQHRFIRCYTYTQQYAFVLFSGVGIRSFDTELDFSTEGNMTDILYFADDGTHITAFSGLRIRLHAESASNSIFKCDATWTDINITGLDLFSDGIPTSGKVFDNLTPWQIIGDFTFSSSLTWTSPTGGYTGFVSQGFVRNYYGNLPQLAVGGGSFSGNPGILAVGGKSVASASIAFGTGSYAETYGKIAFANGSTLTGGDAQAARTMMRVATTSTASARLTANGASITATTIVNPRTGSAYIVTAKLIARDTVTGDAAFWTTSQFMMTCGASSSTLLLRGSPVFTAGFNTGGGSLAGAALPTITGDAINGGLNVSVAATGTNLVHWVCEITTVEVL